ncbi:MAG: lipopolysaccharide heptosyltransferase II [Planctomycetota bacterium]|nr:lipopolysaccharide heptosyltransferase II [Planctomycetota bacterium]
MPEKAQHRESRRLLVVLPTWVGDTVMATPTLRALRRLYPAAHIAALVRPSVRPILEPCPWIDRVISMRIPRRGVVRALGADVVVMARELAAEKFDTAVLLPNSFRTALLIAMAKIPRRVGYDRDGRGFLLTDRLLPLRSPGRYVPVPTRDYYLGLARYLGSLDPDPAMELFTAPEDDARADAMLRDAGFDASAPGSPGSKLVLLNPGANYGDAKMWYPDRFAAVADRCRRELGATLAVTGAPKERAIVDRVLAAAKEPIIDLTRLGLDLGTLKGVVRRSALMITNDTGPRHIAAAMGVPVVTIFGPTDPVWSEIEFPAERKVMVKVFCGPCQKKRCPLDHRCMTQVEPDMVFDQAAALLRGSPRLV